MPLVLLDPGAIFAMYVGGSEECLRSALATVGAMAPVVRWIDEIEKGFAGAGSTRSSSSIFRTGQEERRSSNFTSGSDIAIRRCSI